MYFPFFSLGCNLEINENRTAAYLNNACSICTPTSLLRSLGDRYVCNCDALNWEVIVDEDGDEHVVQVNYVSPDVDNAPWYNPAVPESAGFLGFLVNDVTMDSVVSRSVTTRATAFGGGVLGPLRKKERTIVFNVYMFACDSASMDYGFRYLTDALGGIGCDDECTLCDATYRDNCAIISDGTPTVEEVQAGTWQLKSVGLVTGPNYTDNPAPSLACNVRQVTFTVAAELPYKYRCPIQVTENEQFEGMPDGCQSIDSWFCDSSTISSTVTESVNIGETALIVNITAGSKPLGGIILDVIPDTFGYVCAPETAPPGYTPPEGCARVHLTEIPSGAQLIYDTATERITMVLPGGNAVDGSPYIDTRYDTIPTFPTLRCGSFCVQISVDRCSVTTGSVLSIESVHREL